MGTKYAFIMWDWKEQMPASELNAAMVQVFDGVHCPSVMSLDTGSDDFALIIMAEPVDRETAHKLFAEWYESL